MIKKIINNNLVNTESIVAWIFILPCILGCFLFILIPILSSFMLSFFQWNLISSPKFVGLLNYVQLFNGNQFWKILGNTVFFALVTTILGTIFPLILAYIIANKIKMSDFFKTTFFLPFITPMIVVATVWEWVFDPNLGLLNYIFKTHVAWLYNPNTAMAAIIIVSVWKLVGYNMVIFLSGMASLNLQVFESAKIDGANEPSIFAKILVPLLSPTIFFVLVITTISSFQVFDLIYLMTQGGPENSTNVLVYWLYKNAFEFFRIGEASAIAYILFLFVFILTVIQWVVRKRWVYNE